jgi:excisionase family DNA binding protein
MLTAKMAAAQLGISSSKLYELAAQRRIAHFRIGGKLLFEQNDLDTFKKAARVETASARIALPPVQRRPLRLKHVLLAREETLAPVTSGRNV